MMLEMPIDTLTLLLHSDATLRSTTEQALAALGIGNDDAGADVASEPTGGGKSGSNKAKESASGKGGRGGKGGKGRGKGAGKGGRGGGRASGGGGGEGEAAERSEC